jgi:hypothetical protein
MRRECRVFQKELYNGIPNVTVWRVLRKKFTLKGVELWTERTPLSKNVLVTVVTL